MLIGYMRVSTAEQSLNLQRDALERARCERLFEDVASGACKERHGLAQAIDHARSGDTLVVWKLDRIARSLAHVVQLVSDLRDKAIGLKVLTGDIDTTSTTGRVRLRHLRHPRRIRARPHPGAHDGGLEAARARGR